MDRVSLDEVSADDVGGGGSRRSLSAALSASDVAINHYRFPPGTGFPGGLHAHADQEEVFVVLAGAATFETLAGEVGVRAGEVIRFPPGEFQSGRNDADADADLVALAVGAPRESEDVRLPFPCPDCGDGDLRLVTGGDGVTFECPGCGAGHVPGPCPDCGGTDLAATLDEVEDPVVRCRDCGAAFERPPLRT